MFGKRQMILTMFLSLVDNVKRTIKGKDRSQGEMGLGAEGVLV